MVLWPATALALVHLLRPWSLALTLATVSCLLLAWTLRRTPPRELLGGLRGEARAGWPVVVFGLLAVTAIAVARLSIPVDASAGGWRYWSDGLEFADAGSVPSTVLQWGALHAPAISKLGANSFDAGLSFVLRDHPFSAMAAALWISAVGFAAGMFALGWELGLRWCAAALPLLALTGHAWPGGLVLDADIVHKLTFFQTEDSGRMCMLAALVLAVPLLRGDAGAGLPRAVATGALIGAAALTHLVAVIGIAPLMVGYAVAAAVRSGRWRTIARWSIATAAGGLAVAAMALVLAGGDLGFQGASGTPYRAVNGRYDPTAALLGLKKTPIPKSRRRFYTPPVTAARNLYSTATALPAHGRTLVLPLLALGLLGLAAVLLGGRPERLAVAAALFALASLYAIELLFSARYAYYVPATFGDRRVFEYASLPLLVLGAAGVNALFARTRQLRPRLPAVCAAALPVLIIAGIGWNGLTAGVHGGPCGVRHDRGGACRHAMQHAAADAHEDARVVSGADRTRQHAGGPDGVPAARPARPGARHRDRRAALLRRPGRQRRPAAPVVDRLRAGPARSGETADAAARAEPACPGRAGLGVRGGRGRSRRTSPRRRARVPLLERAAAMTGRRYTRAGLLALAGAAAAGVAARQLLGGGGNTVSPPPGPAPSRFRLRSAFSGPDGWGPRWVPLQGPLMVDAGPAVLTVPAGVHTTAADQPMPVQLLDAVHADGAQRLEFSVTDASLRPGLLLRSTGPHAFAGVTIEDDRLVIAEYAFDGRRTVASGDTDPVTVGTRHVLDVRYQGGRVWARAWPADEAPEADWQVSGPVAAAAGNPGILAVHPLSLRPCRLEVHSHTVATDAQAAADQPGRAGADLGHTQPAPGRRPRRAHARVERLPGRHQVRVVGGRRRVRPQPRTGRRRVPADGAPPDQSR